MNLITFFLPLAFSIGCLLGTAQATIGDPVIIGAPEQVHLSYGAAVDQLWVTWMTFENESTYKAHPTVQFGFKATHLDQSQSGHATFFWNEKRRSFVHRVLLSKLKHNTTYYYRAGTAEHGWTKTFNFTTKPEIEESWSPRIAIYGDLGLVNGVSIPFINKQVANGAYDAIFHVGDISYNLDSLNGQIGDEFFRQMETSMASLPYQMTVGNHESASNFSQYVSRFTMIDQQSGSVNNHYYSFNIGPVHVVAFSSEFYYFTEYGSMQIQNQFEWLEADLKEANKPENKAKRPWLIVAGHRPMYCSSVDHDDCTDNESILRKGIPIVGKFGLEDLFYRYGVDIIIGAHEHTYERLYPVYDRKVFNGSTEEPYRNPKAPFHFLVGSAGCQEEVDPFVSKPEHWSAKRISDYGISEFHVLNKTHIRVRQRSTVKNGQVVDTVTLIKEKHGPEAWL